jgi:hypothetical protein
MKEFSVPLKSTPDAKVEKGSSVNISFTDTYMRVSTKYNYKINVAEDLEGEPEWEFGTSTVRTTFKRSEVMSSSIDDNVHGDMACWEVNYVPILRFDTSEMGKIEEMDDYLHIWINEM